MSLQPTQTSEENRGPAVDKLTLPPIPQKLEDQTHSRATDKEAKRVAQDIADRELYARCSKEAMDNLVLAESLRGVVGTDKTFCISGYIEDPSKLGEKIQVAFYGNKLNYIRSKDAPFNLLPSLEVKNTKYQFDFSKFKIKNFIEEVDSSRKVILPLEDVDYLFKVKSSFIDLANEGKNGTTFPTEQEIRNRYSLDNNTRVIKPYEGDTYTRFRITQPTIKYNRIEKNSLSDGGHVEFFWGSVVADDEREVKMGEQKIFGAKLLEAKVEKAE